MPKDLDHIDIDGVRFIPVKIAATLADYTADYVGQLCRGGKLEATRIGRAWYVSEASIIAHKEGQILKEDTENDGFSVKEELEKVKKSHIRSHSIFKDSSFVVYERDDRPLIPQLIVRTADEEPMTLEKVDTVIDEKKTEEAIIQPINELAQPKTIQKTQKPVFSNLVRSLFVTTSFAIVFLLLFSVNSTYTSNLIGKGLDNVVANVSESEVAATVSKDILDPYRLSAIKFSEAIDEMVHSVVYGESIYDNTLKR